MRQTISRIAREEGRLHICATGPLTNLALALLLDPDLPESVSAITIMGGAAFCPGNTTPLAEFNFAVDMHAAVIVFVAGPRCRCFVSFQGDQNPVRIVTYCATCGIRHLLFYQATS
ncbi:nucleoside hydrolase [Neorhizobium galegae]|uniref:nucleoside hydrolase n=1 Tax=Neorhizobium galegae TaxID=399 RepID=UPI000621E731|nr:nucleoside hydrolase [Neorhizobium galegae]MCQ1854895.1 nucleoside hydrolase [Neorhizobium galegae]CDZ49772.1 Hypothetical protein NGAL_HAMBI2427_33300 [Neorhizobium galegae bv. orientalis]